MLVKEAKLSRVFIEFLNCIEHDDDRMLCRSLIIVFLLYLNYIGGVIS